MSYDTRAIFHVVDVPAPIDYQAGRTDDVERTVSAARTHAAELADSYGQAIDWRVDHRSNPCTHCNEKAHPVWSSWSGTARPGDLDRAPFQSVALVGADLGPEGRPVWPGGPTPAQIRNT